MSRVLHPLRSLCGLYLCVSDAGSLTVRENRKHIRDRIFFVNECEDIREKVLNGETEGGDGGRVT